MPTAQGLSPWNCPLGDAAKNPGPPVGLAGRLAIGRLEDKTMPNGTFVRIFCVYESLTVQRNVMQLDDTTRQCTATRVVPGRNTGGEQLEPATCRRYSEPLCVSRNERAVIALPYTPRLANAAFASARAATQTGQGPQVDFLKIILAAMRPCPLHSGDSAARGAYSSRSEQTSPRPADSRWAKQAV